MFITKKNDHQLVKIETKQKDYHSPDPVINQTLANRHHDLDILLGFKNLLINGDFRIWQRGETITNELYVADRWISTSSGVTSRTVSKQYNSSTEFTGNYLHCVANTVDTTVDSRSLVVAQRCEITSVNYESYLDQWYTVSCWLRSSLDKCIVYVFAYDGTNVARPAYKVVDLTFGWNFVTWSYYLDRNKFDSVDFNNLRFVELFGVLIGNHLAYSEAVDWPPVNANDYLDVAYVQVERGKIATKFEHRPYNIELNLCRRYFQRIRYVIAPKTGTSDDLWAWVRVYPMRTTPSAVIKHPTTLAVNQGILGWWENAQSNVVDHPMRVTDVGSNGCRVGYWGLSYPGTSRNDMRLTGELWLDAELGT